MFTDLYASGRKRLLDGRTRWVMDPIKVALIEKGAYTPRFDVDEYLASVPVDARPEKSTELTHKTVRGGAMDADRASFMIPCYRIGWVIGAVLIYHDTGTEATSPLIGYIAMGGDGERIRTSCELHIDWDRGPNRIFRLTTEDVAAAGLAPEDVRLVGLQPSTKSETTAQERSIPKEGAALG